MTRRSQLASAALIMLIAGPSAAQNTPAPKVGPTSTPTVAASVPSPKVAPQSSAQKAPQKTNAQIAAGIKRLGEGRYEIQRAVLPDLLIALSRQARLVPRYLNGTPQGFKILAIRADSLYGQIGLQVDDALKGIDGQIVKGPADALEAYIKIKNSNTFSVMLEREGRAITQDYTIK